MARKEQIVEIVREDGPVRRNDIAEKLPIKANYAGTLLSELADEHPPRLKRVVRNGEEVEGLYDLPERVDDENRGEASEPENDSAQQSLPLLNADAHASQTGAAWKIEVESYMGVDRDILRSQSGGNPDQMAIMTVTGNSMADTINPGDQIIIVRHQEGDRILQGSVYVWLNAQRGVLVKRAIWQDDGSLLLRPDNDECPEIHISDIEAPSWRPIGRVFRVMRAV
jgi:phage repressor protein C with HTH and peptisase S24 domain